MSGPSLSTRLRDQRDNARTGSLCAEAADRIAKLEVDRDQARDCLDQQRDNYATLLAERDAERKVYHDTQWRQLNEMTAERDGFREHSVWLTAEFYEANTKIDALRKALEHAAQFLKDWDGGDPNTADGWAYDEFLAEWTAIRSLLSEGGGE